MDFTNLAQKYGTPLYVYDFDYMAHRYEALKTRFTLENLSYATLLRQTQI